MSALPKGWATSTIGEWCVNLDSKRIPINSDERKERLNGKKDHELYPYYGATGQVGRIDGYLFDGEYVLIGEDGAPFMDPYKNKAYMVSGRFWVNNHAHILEPHANPKFTCYYLNQFRYADHVTGTTRLKLTKAALEQMPIVIPPLAEQRRIVEKVEELFSELDEGVANLKQARAQLAVYRQALLKHAFEGHLTADWRTKHAPELESADQLLARIRAEREERYQDDLQAWNNRKGKGDLIRDGEILTKPRKPKPPYRLDSDEEAKLTELPSGWKWMTFESLSSPAQRSIQSGPFGSSLKHSEFSEEGILVIGIDNVQKGYFSKGSQNRIPPKTYERLRKYSARPHDVLMTVMATVGRCCSVPADLETAIITKHVYRTSPNLRLVSPSFVVSALLGCPATVKAVEKDKVGQTRPGINGDILKWLPIPLPPLEEQEEIMRTVSASLEGVDALEADIDLNLQKAEALRQSILKKAFAGELVPQDPADEPAAALLARIRAEREAQAATPKPIKTRTKKA